MVFSRLGPKQFLERRLCLVLGQSRSTQRYRPRKPDDDRRLIDELRRWVQWYPRFGSERVHSPIGVRRGIFVQQYDDGCVARSAISSVGRWPEGTCSMILPQLKRPS
jgi:hypothetical protein